jgi:hypothetical protein
MARHHYHFWNYGPHRRDNTVIIKHRERYEEH